MKLMQTSFKWNNVDRQTDNESTSGYSYNFCSYITTFKETTVYQNITQSIFANLSAPVEWIKKDPRR